MKQQTEPSGLKRWWELELVLLIFDCLDMSASIPSLGLVCSEWHRFALSPRFWKSLNLSGKMAHRIQTHKLSLRRWRHIDNLRIYVGLDSDPRRTLSVLHKLKAECGSNQIRSVALHIFGFDAPEITEQLLQSLKTLIYANRASIESLCLECGHGLKTSVWPESESTVFPRLTHLSLDRVGRLQCDTLRLAHFPHLTHIAINYAGLREHHFLELAARCPHLRYLSIFMLEHEWLDAETTLRVLSAFPNLIGLQFEYPRFEAQTHFFVELAHRLPKLETMYFWWWSITEAHFDAILSHFGCLQQIGFAYSNISTRFLEEHPAELKVGLYGYRLDAMTEDALPHKYTRNAEDIAALFAAPCFD